MFLWKRVCCQNCCFIFSPWLFLQKCSVYSFQTNYRMFLWNELITWSAKSVNAKKVDRSEKPPHESGKLWSWNVGVPLAVSHCVTRCISVCWKYSHRRQVVQLVRDPRGILASRMETFRDTYRLWRLWRATGRRPHNLDLGQINTVCEDFLRSVSTALAKPAWLRGRYILLRWESVWWDSTLLVTWVTEETDTRLQTPPLTFNRTLYLVKSRAHEVQVLYCYSERRVEGPVSGLEWWDTPAPTLRGRATYFLTKVTLENFPKWSRHAG